MINYIGAPKGAYVSEEFLDYAIYDVIQDIVENGYPSGDLMLNSLEVYDRGIIIRISHKVFISEYVRDAFTSASIIVGDNGISVIIDGIDANIKNNRVFGKSENGASIYINMGIEAMEIHKLGNRLNNPKDRVGITRIMDNKKKYLFMLADALNEENNKTLKK